MVADRQITRCCCRKFRQRCGGRGAHFAGVGGGPPVEASYPCNTRLLERTEERLRMLMQQAAAAHKLAMKVHGQGEQSIVAGGYLEPKGMVRL